MRQRVLVASQVAWDDLAAHDLARFESSTGREGVRERRGGPTETSIVGAHEENPGIASSSHLYRTGMSHRTPAPPSSTHAHTYPLRAPVKKKRTTNTCSAAIATMTALSNSENRKMRFSVLRTVLKLRFSRVRKYFCWRVIVDSWPLSL